MSKVSIWQSKTWFHFSKQLCNCDCDVIFTSPGLDRTDKMRWIGASKGCREMNATGVIKSSQNIFVYIDMDKVWVSKSLDGFHSNKAELITFDYQRCMEVRRPVFLLYLKQPPHSFSLTIFFLIIKHNTFIIIIIILCLFYRTYRKINLQCRKTANVSCSGFLLLHNSIIYSCGYQIL